MNEYDSAKIADILKTIHGFSQTADTQTADLIILNTCSVRAKAEEKIFSELGRLRILKKNNPHLILAVGGCVAMQEQKKILQRAPHVDIVFGPRTLHHLPQMYDQALHQKSQVFSINTPQTEKFNYFPKPQLAAPIAYISIMEGCNKFCSYCIVPYTRGREISRPSQDIISEINALVVKGAKEIQLLGQNVNAYREPNTQQSLAELIHTITSTTNIKRIRFITSHPAEFGDDLISLFATEPKLANQLHLPLQSGSDRILKLMRRGYTQIEYQSIIDKLRKIRPDISISTDLIVGFPGETAKDFALTMEAVQTINFDAAFSFIYSPRPNTTAAKLKDDLPLTVKKQRLTTLQNQLAAQARQYNEKMLGTTQKVLISSCSKKDTQQFSGRTVNNRIVNFTASNNTLGDIVAVKITAVLSNSLRGEIAKQ